MRMINVEIRGCRSGKLYAAGTAEEAHQQLMEQFPLRKHKIITEKAVRNVIEIYPEPLYKKKVRGDRI
ncbi:hypothetical protein [Tetragenococcus halophilus]|uniref:hypothetical protein n=1 Tax=Tetragenococcus halophilus TaxID=51669 RepID=UPI0034A1BC8C